MDDAGNILTPVKVIAVNVNDIVLLTGGLTVLKRIAREVGFSLTGTECNGDAGFDSRKNRKAIWDVGMIPNIPENPRRRNRSKPKRGRPRRFDPLSYRNRFIVERTFAWEDTYRSLVIRYDRKEANYRGRKLLAYALINLRSSCGKVE